MEDENKECYVGDLVFDNLFELNKTSISKFQFDFERTKTYNIYDEKKLAKINGPCFSPHSQKILIRQTKIRSIQADNFSNLFKLTFLSLSYNFLETLQQYFIHLYSLEHLLIRIILKPWTKIY